MPQENRILTANFGGSIDASSKRTFVSKRIDLPFRVKKIRAFFGADTEWKTRIYLFISPDAEAPTTKAPNGTNILTQLSQQVYLTSGGGIHEFQQETGVEQSGMYLKVYVDNTDTFSHNIAVTITIEIIYPEKVKPETK